MEIAGRNNENNLTPKPYSRIKIGIFRISLVYYTISSAVELLNVALIKTNDFTVLLISVENVEIKSSRVNSTPTRKLPSPEHFRLRVTLSRQ
jgi:hypothetical protein